MILFGIHKNPLPVDVAPNRVYYGINTKPPLFRPMKEICGLAIEGKHKPLQSQ
jgi:hypothetical protein